MSWNNKLYIIQSKRNTLKLLPKQIWEEHYTYYSDKSVDDLKDSIQQLFDRNKGLQRSINLIGYFTSDNEFKMSPKWWYTKMRWFEKELSYLSGTIFQNVNKKTQVSLTIRPNSNFAFLFFMFPVVGLYALTLDNNRSNTKENVGLILGIVFIFILPIITMILGYVIKRNIKNVFVRTFNLLKLPTN